MQMDKDQLISLILESYSAKKEIKEYFDFYTNPDVKALREKFELKAKKELLRVKRGSYSKARISVLRKLIKEFDAFSPGYEAMITLRLNIVEMTLAVESHTYMSPALLEGIAQIARDMIIMANQNQIADIVLIRVDEMLSDERKGSRYFRSLIKKAVTNGLQEDSSNLSLAK